MARALYPGDIFLAAGTGSPPIATLAPNAEFTMWNARAGGTKQTDLKAVDGITALPLNGSSNPYATSAGLRPELTGPDGYVLPLWCDTGVGERFPVYPVDVLSAILQFAALINVAQTWTAAQTFNAGISVPDNTFSISDVNGLTAALAGASGGSVDPEGVRDTVAAALVQAGYVSIVVNDAGDTITIGSTAALATALAARLTTPTFTANQGIVAFNLETSGGTYDALPSDIGAMAVIWIGTDEPATGTRTGDMRYRLP